MPADDDADVGCRRFVTDDSVAYYMARVRGGIRLIIGGNGVAGKGPAGIAATKSALRRPFHAWTGAPRHGDPHGGTKASIHLGPAPLAAIPHRTSAMRNADRAVAVSRIPVYETTSRDHHPAEMTKVRIGRDDGRLCRPRRQRGNRPVSLRRDSRRARLSDFAISCRVRESPALTNMRLAREPCPFRPRRVARGEGRGA